MDYHLSAGLTPAVSSVGGAASSFNPLPTSPLEYARYVYQHDAGPSSSSSYLSPWQNAALKEPERVQNCISRANKVREANMRGDEDHYREYGAFQLPNGTLYEGTRRKGALFCRTGRWLEIVDEKTVDEQKKRKKDMGLRHVEIDTVRGTKNESSRYTILEFLSVSFGLLSIRGVDTGLYLCMDKRGLLYSAPASNYSTECIFMEEMEQNYYNVYSSCVHGTTEAPWYVALRRTGRQRKGRITRKRRKAAHFLVVHYDLSPEKKVMFSEEASQAEAHRAATDGSWNIDLNLLLSSSLRNAPMKNRDYNLDLITTRETPEERIEDEKKIEERRKIREEKRRQKKKRQRPRERRLRAEDEHRRKRKQELAELRKMEPMMRERKMLEQQERLMQQHKEKERTMAERVEAERRRLYATTTPRPLLPTHRPHSSRTHNSHPSHVTERIPFHFLTTQSPRTYLHPAHSHHHPDPSNGHLSNGYPSSTHPSNGHSSNIHGNAHWMPHPNAGGSQHVLAVSADGRRNDRTQITTPIPMWASGPYHTMHRYPPPRVR